MKTHLPKTILFILGTRPEAIKLAPLILEMKKHPEFKVRLCSTGQHREMLQPLFGFFSIKPDFDLDLMKPGQSLGSLSSRCTNALDHLLDAEKIDAVIVQGDTTSCFIGSLAAFYRHIPVFHVEAGLRSGNIHSPFPEEFNRRATGLLARFHYAPTLAAQNNLLKERVLRQNILVTGNTGIDALFQTLKVIDENPQLSLELREQFHFLNTSKKLILVTLHRRESFGDSIEEVFKGLRELRERDDVQILIPLHLNPKVRQSAEKILGDHGVWADNSEMKMTKHGNPIFFIEPLDYVPFIYVMKRSYLLLTDSGGLQEEGPSIKKPVLVARENTERPEGIMAGSSKLIPLKMEGVINSVNRLLDSNLEYNQMIRSKNPYGDGLASQRITQHMKEVFT